jgi:ligand-binding sensor domain-containing protein
VRDSRGFLWFYTADGISRFDGYRFVTFDSRQGLPNPSTNDLLETRAGVYWIATNGAGIARLDPSSDATVQNHSRVTPVSPGDQNQSLFKIYAVGDQTSTNRVNVLFEDRQGRIWAGTDGGLFQMDPGSGSETFTRVDLALADSSDFRGNIWQIEEDQQQNLWFGTMRGLWHSRPDGRVVQYRAPAVAPRYPRVYDREGRIWAGSPDGVLIFKSDQMAGKVTEQNPRWQEIAWSQRSHEDTRVRLPEAPGEALRYTTAEGFPSEGVHAIYQADDGRMWIGTERGLAELAMGGSAKLPVCRSRLYSDRLWRDRDRNLWIGTYSGPLKLARNGLTYFGKSDGLEGDITQIDHIFETPEGELGIITDARLYNFDGLRFTPIQPRFGAAAGRINHVMRDRAGDYWISTSSGLYQFPPVRYLRDLARTAPKAVYTASTESKGGSIRFAFEDSRGDIWIGTTGARLVSRWERATGTIYRYQESDGVPRGTTLDITEDRGGTIWFSVRDGGLVRYRDGRFSRFSAAQVPAGYDILGLFPDQAGRLWLAINGAGLVRIDQTEADQPSITTYTIAQGLSTNAVRNIIENQLGQIYIATTRGIDRLDPATGHIKHYSTADGLAGNETITVYRDRQDTLWFGSSLGLSRLEPAPERRDPPPVFISGLQVSVFPPAFAFKQTRIEGLVFEPGQRQFPASTSLRWERHSVINTSSRV